LFELARMGCPGPLPSRITVHRILVRHGLVDERPRRRRREDYLRWERDRPMELWQMDIVGGIMLADGREAKVVTGVDDHSRLLRHRRRRPEGHRPRRLPGVRGRVAGVRSAR
jgi:hypothetical protein